MGIHDSVEVGLSLKVRTLGFLLSHDGPPQLGATIARRRCRSSVAWSRDLFVELAIGLPHSQLSEERVPDNIQGRPMFEGLNRALENPAHAVTFLHDLGTEIKHLL